MNEGFLNKQVSRFQHQIKLDQISRGNKSLQYERFL